MKIIKIVKLEGSMNEIEEIIDNFSNGIIDTTHIS
jgi:hypothetical protein